METLRNETLPGYCKSQYALNKALNIDKNNQDFMKEKAGAMYRGKTKGRFNRIEYQTNAGVWLKDREWKKTANPGLFNIEERKESIDVAMLEKRKK